ncbi:MAG: TetR/AcrR family transcriptional regulator [Methylococcaceae bacterium]
MNSKEKILSQAIVLFAQKGYSGLSMRRLAQAVEMSVAAIYHHFPDKKNLYFEAVRFAFSDKAAIFTEVWRADCSAEEKLTLFVRLLIDVMLQDRGFCLLIQREIMEADPDRMQLLAQGVFKEQFCLLAALATELRPDVDAYLTAISIISLAKHYVECQPLRKNFPGWKPEHETPAVIAAHITELLLNGLRTRRT